MVSSVPPRRRGWRRPSWAWWRCRALRSGSARQRAPPPAAPPPLQIFGLHLGEIGGARLQLGSHVGRNAAILGVIAGVLRPLWPAHRCRLVIALQNSSREPLRSLIAFATLPGLFDVAAHFSELGHARIFARAGRPCRHHAHPCPYRGGGRGIHRQAAAWPWAGRRRKLPGASPGHPCCGCACGCWSGQAFSGVCACADRHAECHQRSGRQPSPPYRPVHHRACPVPCHLSRCPLQEYQTSQTE